MGCYEDMLNGNYQIRFICYYKLQVRCIRMRNVKTISAWGHWQNSEKR